MSQVRLGQPPPCCATPQRPGPRQHLLGSAQRGGSGGMRMTSPALAPHHYTMLVQESGIIDAVIAESGYRSIDGAQGLAELKTCGSSGGCAPCQIATTHKEFYESRTPCFHRRRLVYDDTL